MAIVAAVGSDQPDEDPHQRRLAGAVLSEDAVDLAAMEVEVDAVAGDDLAVALADVADGDSRMRPVGHNPGSLPRAHPVVTGAPPP